MQRNCVDAFCDLLDYGKLLMPNDWPRAVAAARNLATLETLLRLEKIGFVAPKYASQTENIIRHCPRNKSKVNAKGAHVTEHAEDFHLRLCVTWAENTDFRDKLDELLAEARRAGY